MPARVKFPGPYCRPLLGLLPEFRRDPAGMLLDLSRRFDPICYFRMGPQDVYLINDPELIRDILVTNGSKFIKNRFLQRAKVLLGEGLLTSEGEHHFRQRRLAQPAFHRDRLAQYSKTMVIKAEHSTNLFQEGAVLEMDREMMRLTLAIVGKTLFNAEVEEDAAEVGEALEGLMDSFHTLLLPFSEYLEKVPFLPFSRRLRRVRKTLDSIIYRIIRERRASGRDEGDLLSMLLMARDEEDGQSMSDEQVRDEALTLFLAGHETTANALTWTWYLLSQNPEAERRMHQEIDRVLGGRLPGFEDYPSLPYTEMIFSEALRLYPPAWAVGRRSIEPFQLRGQTIPPGAIFALSQYVMHRNPRFWDCPDDFRPERFLPEAREARPRFSYFPFGGGTRVCIGERFAWLEGVLLLATIGRKWRFRLVADHPVKVHPVITLRAKYGMRMTAERR